MKEKSENISSSISFEDFKNQILADYKTIVLSRECSYLGRKEVLSGKAKFGIFGDGKELPQIALSKAFQKALRHIHNLQKNYKIFRLELEFCRKNYL